jgi:hypothetical protein
MNMHRRSWIKSSTAISAGILSSILLPHNLTAVGRPSKKWDSKPGNSMRFGLVTYQWGKDWELDTLLENCQHTKVQGVELRTTHAHGVEPALNQDQRQEVKQKFSDAEIVLVGIGSNERYDNPDPTVVKQAIERTKQFIKLSHDVGGTGVKVKPDRFYDNIPHEKTIEQIGLALNELGSFGAGWGQQIRLEVHGQCAELPTIKAIMEIADHPNVAVCWNCNPQDLQGDGLEHNFNLVRDRFGATLHCREIDFPDYPNQKLMQLLVKSDYAGWIMLEQGTVPANPVTELARQNQLFYALLQKTQKDFLRNRQRESRKKHLSRVTD